MSNNAPPTVSVLMAVYNGLPHLREAVASVLAQTMAAFEFIIVDDGSTDGTTDLLAEFVAADDRVRVLTNERNLGLTASLNVGLRAARASLIARQDADDVSLPDRLGAQVAFMGAHPEVVLVGTAATVIDGAGRRVQEMALPLSDAAIRWHMLLKNAFCHTSAMFRRELDGHPVLYDESFQYAQDYELWSRLQHCGHLRNMPEALVKLRRHAVGITATQRPEQARLAREISLANMRELLNADSGDESSAAVLREWWQCPPRRITLSDLTVCELLLEMLAAFTNSCPSAAVVRDDVLGRVAMGLIGADTWATHLWATMQAIAPDADLAKLAAAAERALRSSPNWARGLRWRAWECARSGRPGAALRNLRHAVAVSPLLLLSPRTWLVPIRALLGLVTC